MKKLILVFFLCATMSASAQNDKKCCEQTKCEQTQREKKVHGRKPRAIEVAPEHKEAFEALKKEYAEAKKEVYKKYRGEKLEKGQKPTEEQMDARMKNHMACQKALVELQEKYYPKFRKMLNPFQTAQVLKLWGNNNNFQRQKGLKGKGAPRGHHREHKK